MHLPLPRGRRAWLTLLAMTLLTAFVVTTISPGTAFGKWLRSYGLRGQNVVQAQSIPAEAGELPGPADGVSQPANGVTDNALPKDDTLPAPGEAGLPTPGALPSAAPPPAPPAPPTPPAAKQRFTVMGYYDENWSGDNDAWNSLSAHAGQLDLVSPFWFTVNANGTVSNRGSNWGRVVKTSHDHGAKVLALFNNADGNNAVLTNDAARRQAAKAITTAVVNNGLDGAVLDFESLAPSTRGALTSLVRDLAGRLHASGRLLAVAVGPKWSSDESLNDGAAAYDYRALGGLADYVQIMAYDQHTINSGAGPIASLPWVQGIAKYASSQIAPAKILLGLAGYGYEWPARDSSGVVYARDAASLAASGNAPVLWDDGAQESHFRYTDKAGTTHTVWFENGHSVQSKLDVVRRYGLGGVALWRLGQEDGYLWAVLP